MIDFRLPIVNPVNLHGFAEVTRIADNVHHTDAPQTIQTVTGPLTFISSLPWESGVGPSSVAYRLDDIIVICFTGIGSALDSWRVYQGSLNFESVPDLPGTVNRYAKAWYDARQDFVAAASEPLGNRYYFCGHSWGGTVATLFAARYKDPQSSRAVSLLTFGSPKFADRSFMEVQQWDEWARVMNHRDLTPALIPWPQEAPLFAACHTPFQMFTLNRPVYMSNGIRCRQGHPLQDGVVPSGFNFPLETNPTTLVDYLQSGVPEHSMRAYVETLAESVGPQVNPNLWDHHGAEPRPAESVDQWTEEEILDFTDDAFDDATELTKTVPNPSPTATKVRAVRLKKRHYVTIDGVVAYRASGRRDAVAVARAMRKYGEQLRQNVKGFTNPEALNFQLQGALPFDLGDVAEGQ